MYSSSRATCERLGSLQSDLTALKSQLAEAWSTPGHSASVPKIEHRIRQVWEQMDRLAVSLTESITHAHR